MINLPQIKIEKGVPLPPSTKIGKWRDLLEKLEVGDSFFLPNNVRAANIHSNLAVPARRLGIKITVRAISDGVRVWRIK